MSKVRELHNKAMELAQLALIARHKGEFDKAELLARQAYESEANAAELIPDEKASEPTRSILYRSAASLAYQCKEFKIAQRLIAKGLSGFPPDQIEQELKELYEQVNYEYQLQERGLELQEDDIQMSLHGNSVGYGTIDYDEFIKRINMFPKVIKRTVQRLMKLPYQVTGKISEKFRPFTTTVSALEAGSFAITFKLGIAKEHQMELYSNVNASSVIDDILTDIELINQGNLESLKKRITDEGYYRNFVSLIRDIAPDGDKINIVKFISSKKIIGLTRRHRDIELTPKIENTDHRPIVLKGLLDYATSRNKSIIGITDKSGKSHSIFIEKGMEDLVRSYYGQWIVVEGTWDGKYIYPTEIRSDDD